VKTVLELTAGFAAGVVAWFATHFIAKPVRQFFDLRGEVIRCMTQYGNVPARYKELRGDNEGLQEVLELSPTESNRLQEAQVALRDLASRMRAFAQNETWAVGIVKWLGHDPMKASEKLIGLSNSIDTYGGNRAAHDKAVRDVLRIRD
jgi:hypothetical protein